MEPTGTVSPLVDATARLTAAQKRDLLGQAVAAVVTTALIAAPFIAPPSGSAFVSSEATLPAQSFAGVATAVAVEASERPRAGVRHVRAAARLLPSTSGRQAADAIGSRKPLSRKLTGWLTGDGTHTVRPFPTVAVRQE